MPDKALAAHIRMLGDVPSSWDYDEPDFPQPVRRDGQAPCGECRLKTGETCDICGAMQTEPTYGGIPLSEHARSGVYGWHPGDDA